MPFFFDIRNFNVESRVCHVIYGHFQVFDGFRVERVEFFRVRVVEVDLVAGRGFGVEDVAENTEKGWICGKFRFEDGHDDEKR